MRKKEKIPYLIQLVKQLAPKVGAKVILEPEWNFAAQIVYKNGVVRSLRGCTLDLNHLGSSEIAKDKGYAKFFMKQKGYPVAEGRTFFENGWAKIVRSNRTVSAAVRYAEKIGYPVIVKPNSKTQGREVWLVFGNGELRRALFRIFKIDRVALVEKYLPGRDYRIVVLDSEVISAYERVPLSVTGDGENSILTLLKRQQNSFVLSGRDTQLDFHDERIKLKLERQGYGLRTVLAKGEKVFLLDNANLSTGGEALDVTQTIHRGFRRIAVDLTRDMGLRIAGVDIMVTQGDITKNPNDSKSYSYYIIEINAAPGLDHYATTGKAQRKIVENMYLKILEALGKKD